MDEKIEAGQAGQRRIAEAPQSMATHLAQSLQYISAFVRNVRRYFYDFLLSIREAVRQQNFHPAANFRTLRQSA
jgi:hypothetical protein